MLEMNRIEPHCLIIIFMSTLLYPVNKTNSIFQQLTTSNLSTLKRHTIPDMPLPIYLSYESSFHYS